MLHVVSGCTAGQTTLQRVKRGTATGCTGSSGTVIHRCRRRIPHDIRNWRLVLLSRTWSHGDDSAVYMIASGLSMWLLSSCSNNPFSLQHSSLRTVIQPRKPTTHHGLIPSFTHCPPRSSRPRCSHCPPPLTQPAHCCHLLMPPSPRHHPPPAALASWQQAALAVAGCPACLQ